MRIALIGLGIVVAALAADMRSASAQGGYNNRWCTDGSGRGNFGVLMCSYATLDQCRAAARGLRMGCVENPDYRWQQRGRPRY
jgi:hypothetical protein